MTARRPRVLATAPIAEALPPLLSERGLSLRGLAEAINRRRQARPKAGTIDAIYLSRAVRGVAGKRVSGSLAAEIATALDLPSDYFYEYRFEHVVERLAGDPTLVDEIYSRAPKR